MVASCSSFFDEDSSYIIDADKNHLSNSTDTVYSVIGILNKLQTIADRTVLLGEARGDLVEITAATGNDLRQIASFTVDDENIYNNPEDYYAIINNCNYFIANADIEMKDSRNKYIFKSEYAAVKAIRAWTYLQLVTTYGKVPFTVDPILTNEQAEMPHEMKDIQQVCDYFLHQDNLQEFTYPEVDYPHYSNIKGYPSRLFYIPMNLILGDLNLWAGNYEEAAKCYYNYIQKRNGTNSTYYTSVAGTSWINNQWNVVQTSNIGEFFGKPGNSAQAEMITIIPTDSIPSEGAYSSLRSIFNTDDSNNDYTVELTPSAALQNLSAAQSYCLYYNDEAVIAPKNLPSHRDGDLRLCVAWTTYGNAVSSLGDRYEAQYINKWATEFTPNVNIYRRTLVYLRLAEALNRAGHPEYAFHILSHGINTEVIDGPIAALVQPEELQYLKTNFDFKGDNASGYIVRDDENKVGGNTQGIHSRGCGYTPLNPNYQMPMRNDIVIGVNATDEADSIRIQKAYMINAVENLIVDEDALEFAFEGYRYYNLLRVALRRSALGEGDTFLKDKLQNRRGEGKDPGIQADLTNKANWFLRWKGQLGY